MSEIVISADDPKDDKKAELLTQLIRAASRYCTLDKEHNLVPATLMEWAKFIEKNENKVVKQDTLPNEGGKNILVSTVFLGLDHGFGSEALYFETMVFGGPLNHDQDRCETWKEAEEMHERMLKRVKLAAIGVFDGEEK